MELNRQGHRGVLANDRGQDIRQRQNPRANGASLPAKSARGERQNRILDVGPDHARGEPAGKLDRIIEPHHDVARVERDPGHVGIEPVEEGHELVAGQIGVVLDGQSDSQAFEARS